MIDESAFKNALGQFATGVTVVTTLDDENRLTGLTVSSFTSVSLQPTLVLVCVDFQADCYPSLIRRGSFAVNVLAYGQDELALGFAQAGQGKIDWILNRRPEWRLSSRDIPVLSHSLAQVECRLVKEHQGGDHGILVGEVLAVAVDDSRPQPLLYYRGAFVGLSNSG
jgi:flavin reductase (DIM6/NTAB) family NADH-FMN oxidoreductase RutF